MMIAVIHIIDKYVLVNTYLNRGHCQSFSTIRPAHPDMHLIIPAQGDVEAETGVGRCLEGPYARGTGVIASQLVDDLRKNG